jgi:hypothetical protein
MPLCKGARLKIERANHHITDIELRIDSLKKRLIVTAQIDANTGCEFIHCDFADIKDRNAAEDLAIVLGDAIHNLKCALDHVWFETINRLVPGGDWRRTKFPVYPTPDALKDSLEGMKIDISAPKFFSFVTGKIQPYDAGNFSIRTVHQLDTRDKHRLLIPVLHYSSIGDIFVEDENGRVTKGSTWGTTDPLPHFVNFVPGLHIKNPGSASFNVMFEYGNVGRETRMMDTLRFYSQDILAVVSLFEQFVEA